MGGVCETAWTPADTSQGLEGQVRSICSELEKHKTENSKALASLKHEVKTDIENLSHKLHSDFTTSLSAAMTQQSNEIRQMLQGITGTTITGHKRTADNRGDHMEM